MELYVKSAFWVTLIGGVIKIAIMSIRKYPHQSEDTLGLDLLALLERAIWVIWAGILLWWHC